MGLFSLESSLCQDRAEYDTSDSGLQSFFSFDVSILYSAYCRNYILTSFLWSALQKKKLFSFACFEKISLATVCVYVNIICAVNRPILRLKEP